MSMINPKTKCLVCEKPIHPCLILCTRCRTALMEIRKRFDDEISHFPNKDELYAQFDKYDEGEFEC